MTGYHTYKTCIEACLKCAALCNHCSSACLQEEDVKIMARCIQLDMECAALCYATAQVMSIGGNNAKEICKLCAEACKSCGEECGKHDDEHCEECAEACRRCADECSKIAT